MNRKLIWRAVASASVSCPGHDEVHVFVEAADYEEAKKHLYDRLEEEWQLPVSHITFHNVWNENELCEMSAGPKVPSGLPLLESGGEMVRSFMTIIRCSSLLLSVSGL